MTQEMIITGVIVLSMSMIMPMIAMGLVQLRLTIYERNIMKGLKK